MTDRPTIELVDHPSAGHIDAVLDGTIAGSAFYRVVDGRLVVTHTEVGEEFEGQGIASAIAEHVLTRVRDEGRSIVPLCPFFAGYIERHPEYEPLVDRAMYDRLTS